MTQEEKKEVKKEDKKDAKKEEDKIVLKVDMHCEACKEKVRKSLQGLPGLEAIDINMKDQKVTIKGKVDAKNAFETVKKKSGKRTELISPQLKDVEKKKEEKKEEKKDEKKKEPQDITVVMKVKMHCGGCAKEVRKTIERMKGVYEVKVDLEGEKVTVKGKDINPNQICAKVIKKTGKHAEIVPPKKDEKKDEKDNKKEAKKEDNKKDGDKKESSEEKGDKKGDQKGDQKGEQKGDQKKSDTTPSKMVTEYAYYPEQIFSDENPNACTIM